MLMADQSRQRTPTHDVMIHLASRYEIINNWDEFSDQLRVSFVSSEGALVYIGNDFDKAINIIFDKLTNPFNTDMQLWVEYHDNVPNYLVLTQVIQCEFTGRKTLVLFAMTKISESDKETLAKRYFDAYQTVSAFAKANNCVGMTCYSDLDYFAEKAKETRDYTNVVSRYMFYFPIGD